MMGTADTGATPETDLVKPFLDVFPNEDCVRPLFKGAPTTTVGDAETGRLNMGWMMLFLFARLFVCLGVVAHKSRTTLPLRDEYEYE